jgi:cation transport regulator ChaC
MEFKKRPVYYFAYGSNANPDRMLKRGVRFKSYRRAVLKDHDLVFNKIRNNGSAAANVVPKKGAVVEGVLYELEDPEMGYANLDYYEGYPSNYIYEVMEVVDDDRNTYLAVVYVAHPSMIVEGLKPTEEYFNHILEGCRRKIFSEEYCKKLRAKFKEIFGKEPQL